MKWAQFLLYVMVFSAVVPSAVSAATLYIDPGVSEILRGESLTMAVRLDTDESAGECINTVDGVISYSENIEPVDVSIGNSIFPMWVERPTINKENRTITFAGGIPNGYCGRVDGDPRLTNVLTEIIFRSPGFVVGATQSDSNQAKITFLPETTAYLNDGLGTKADLETLSAQITLNPAGGSGENNLWRDKVSADKVPPEEFSITLLKQDHSDVYFAVFNTTDKQTGIDRYQIMEEPLTKFGSFQWGEADAPWLEATSPQKLQDQSLNSTIRVKAIDKAGNVYIATLIPDESLRTTSHEQIFTIVLVAVGAGLLLLLLIISYFWWANRRRAGTASVESQETESATKE